MTTRGGAAGEGASRTRPAGPLGPGAILMLLSLGAMGILGLFTRHLVPGWQPLPQATPFVAAIAVIHSAVLLGAVVAILVGWHRRASLRLLGAVLVLWLLLHLPAVFAAPASVVAWLGIAEVGSVAVAVWLLESDEAGRMTGARFRCASVEYGCCAMVFGLSHFVYADFTASMVLAWLGFGLGWAYLTGVAHAAAGAAMLAGRLVRLATSLLGLMMAGFAVLVHVPRVAATGGDPTELAFLMCALALCGSAWALAARVVPSVRAPSRSNEDWTWLD